MIRLQETLTSPRSPSECFRYAADFRQLTGWDPTAVTASKTTPGPVGLGTVFEIAVRFGPRLLPMRYEITGWWPPHQVVLRGEGDTVIATDTIRFTPRAARDGGGTDIVYTADLELKGGGAWLDRVVRPIAVVNGRRAINGLRRQLAAEPPIVTRSWSRDLADRLLLPGAAKFTRQGFVRARLPAITTDASDRTVIVTGATSGIGLSAATTLARMGARVVLVGRDAGKLHALRETLIADAGHDRIVVQVADLTLQAEVQALAARLIASEPRIDALINNAGALYAERALTAEGRERSLAINLLAPYTLTRALLPRLAASGSATRPARVVNVSSGGQYLQALDVDDLDYAKPPYDGTKAYAQAKRALVALSRQWNEDWQARHVRVDAMHPGWVDTPGVESSLPGFHRTMRRFLRTPEQGADSIVWLALADAAVPGGQFWLNRQPHVTDVIPGTVVHRNTLKMLADRLESAGEDSIG